MIKQFIVKKDESDPITGPVFRSLNGRSFRLCPSNLERILYEQI